ncbi:MAG: DHA2 family efflux MFS transporter permease subunit [Pseudonocardia sp.]
MTDKRRVRVVLVGLMLGVSLAALDLTVVATAVRTIADDLGGADLQAFATTSYLIASAITTPLYGKLSDLYGRKPLFLVAISVFVVGSLLCTLATSMYQLAAYRAIQGVGAGGLFSLSLTIIADLVPARERARYVGHLITVYGAFGVLGPLVGGLLAGTDEILGITGWRWVFLINVPVGLVALAVVAVGLRVPRRRAQARVDWSGAALLSLGLVPLLVVADEGRKWGWNSYEAWLCYLVGVAGIAGFVLVERVRQDDALLPLKHFRVPDFRLGAIASVAVGFGMFGVITALPLYLQVVGGASPAEAGVLMMPLVVGILATSLVSGKVIERTGRYRAWPIFGSVLMIVGLLWLSVITDETSFVTTAVFMFAFGVGLGGNLQPLTLAMQNAVAARDSGVATAAATFFRSLGGSAGAAVFLTILFSTVGDRIASAFREAAATPQFQAVLRDPAVLADPVNRSVVEGLRGGEVGTALLEDSSFLGKLNPVLAEPFLRGFADATGVVFLAGGVVLVAALAAALAMEDALVPAGRGAEPEGGGVGRVGTLVGVGRGGSALPVGSSAPSPREMAVSGLLAAGYPADGDLGRAAAPLGSVDEGAGPMAAGPALTAAPVGSVGPTAGAGGRGAQPSRPVGPTVPARAGAGARDEAARVHSGGVGSPGPQPSPADGAGARVAAEGRSRPTARVRLLPEQVEPPVGRVPPETVAPAVRPEPAGAGSEPPPGEREAPRPAHRPAPGPPEIALCGVQAAGNPAENPADGVGRAAAPLGSVVEEVGSAAAAPPDGAAAAPGAGPGPSGATLPPEQVVQPPRAAVLSPGAVVPASGPAGPAPGAAGPGPGPGATRGPGAVVPASGPAVPGPGSTAPPSGPGASSPGPAVPTTSGGLLAELPSSVRRLLLRAARPGFVHAGMTLFRQGEGGDTAYLVRSGRIEVFADGALVRAFTAGDVFGELALLGDGVRTATAVARRDSELLGLHRADFDRLLATEPAFARAMVERLATRVPGPDPAAAPQTPPVVALVPAAEGVATAGVRELATYLAFHLRRGGRVARLDADGDPTRWAARLAEAEARHDRVLLVAAHPADAWARFCLRVADRPLVVADPAQAPTAGRRFPRSAQLVVLGGGPGLGRWLDAVRPSAHHLVDPSSPDTDVARLARRVTGRAVGLVLSGGGARGLAHIGVVDVLRRAGAPIDRVGGTSMGAVVAGMVAMGRDTAEMLDLARRELARGRPFGDVVWPRHSLIRGARAERLLDRVFGDARIEDQRSAMFAVSADLVAAEPVVHRHGRIADAVALSVRLPGIAPPRWVGGRLHVDGGILDNLPVETMAADGEGPVVASDVAPRFDATFGDGSRLPGIIDTVGRSMMLAGARRGSRADSAAHTMLAPDLGDLGLFDFARLDEFVDRGRAAAEAALPRLRTLW